MKYILVVWLLSGQTIEIPKANGEVCWQDMQAVLNGPAHARRGGQVEDAECMPADMNESVRKIKELTNGREIGI